MDPTTQYRRLQPGDRMTMASMRLQGFGAHTAQVACASRRAAARPVGKLDFDGVGRGAVRTLLDWKRWSPQQIAATLKRVFPDEPERHVSHETICTAIDAQLRGELRKQRVACLRLSRSTQIPRSRGEDRRVQIPDMVSIHERASRLVLLAKDARDATAASALAGFLPS